MKRLLLSILLLLSLDSFSQLLTWTPDFPQESTGSVIITVDAAKGNQGLLNYTPTTDVYVHTGVITNLSTTPTDWKYVKFNQNFNTPNPALQATYMGSNKWQFTITGGVRAYYGLTNPAETILKIAILFRNGAGTSVQRNTDGGDMYVPVFTTALDVQYTLPLMQPKYNPVPETITKNIGDNISIAGLANKTSTMKIFFNGTAVQTSTNTSTVNANPVITTAGTQTVTLEANDGTTTKQQTFTFFIAPAVTIAPLPAGVREGINYDPGNTSLTLVLYAPSKTRVSVIGDFPGSNWNEQTQYVLNKSPDGNYWWIKLTGLTAGTEYSYQYLVDGMLKIGDPYSEKIQDPYADGTVPAATYPGLKPYPAGLTTGMVSIFQTAAPQYNWSAGTFVRPDKRSMVIYELLLRDFIAAHDWKTLRDTLNYLKNLGVNTIELMPFNEFEGNNSWGYNPDFYFAPDKYYGPKNNLKEFIDSCHKKGMAVVMDMVLNHSFGLSPQVQLYANNNGWPTPANPWFNPDQDAATAGYQGKHPFGVGYDYNHESAATNYFCGRVFENWLVDYRVDGFRFDLSKGFTQIYSGNNASFFGQLDPGRVAIWKKYYDSTQLKSPGSYVILEHFADNNEEIQLADYGMMLWGNSNYNYGQASMGNPTDWNFDYGIFTARGWTKPHLVTYMESHDEERLMYKNLQSGNSFGTYNIRDLNTALQRIELCNAFFLTIPGPKMIWQFGELGYDYPINYCTNGTIDNSCRLDPKPIRWDYLQTLQRKRIYDMMSKLTKLRRDPAYKAAFSSDRITRNLSSGFKWLQVTTDTSNMTVVGNFDVTQTTGTVTFQNAGTWYEYLNGSTWSASGGPQSMTLQPGEYRIYLNRNISGIATGVINPVINQYGLGISAYPNPITGRVNINYTIPATGKVSLDMISISGRQLKNLFSGTKIKGEYNLMIERSSLPVSSGTYIIKVTQDGHANYLKVVIR